MRELAQSKRQCKWLLRPNTLPERKCVPTLSPSIAGRSDKPQPAKRIFSNSSPPGLRMGMFRSVARKRWRTVRGREREERTTAIVEWWRTEGESRWEERHYEKVSVKSGGSLDDSKRELAWTLCLLTLPVVGLSVLDSCLPWVLCLLPALSVSVSQSGSPLLQKPPWHRAPPDPSSALLHTQLRVINVGWGRGEEEDGLTAGDKGNGNLANRWFVPRSPN